MCRGEAVTGEVQTNMSDRTLTCRDCGQEFLFTAGEQAFYTERGYSEPSRCKPCRQARKAQQGTGGGYSSGGYSGGGGGGFGGNGGGQRQFYPAVCSECGKDTEVPFQPTPGKPVYCRDCFQSRRTPRYSNY
jgi:CxxC-x17-CxxC domain-containing protein